VNYLVCSAFLHTAAGVCGGDTEHLTQATSKLPENTQEDNATTAAHLQLQTE